MHIRPAWIPAAWRRPGALVVSVVLGAALCWPTAAQTPADRERAASAAGRTAERLRALQREADALAAQQRTLLAELRKLEIDRQMSIEQLAQLERDRTDAQAQLDAAEHRAAELARSAEAQLPGIEERLVHLYKLGRVGYWRLLLNVEDMQALGRAYRTAAALTALDRARIAEYYATLDALAEERRRLQARADEVASLHAAARQTRAALDKAVAERAALVSAIDARRDLTAQLMGELQAADEQLQTAVARVEADRPSRGDRIGARSVLGASGRSPTGNPALYFELRIDGAPVDPLQWLVKQP